MNQAHEADQGPGLLSNAIAIIAFIVVIAIVIWGLLHLANISTSWFTNLFPRSTPTMQISAPADASSGSPVTISWKYSGSDKGTFAFMYQCREGISLKDADGARVLCGTVHPLLNAASSTMVVTPVLSRIASTTLPFSIVFMPSATGSKQISSTATIAVTAGAEPVVETPITATPVAPKPVAVGVSDDAGASAPVYHGPADLRVRIVNVQDGDLTTVQFDIANVGGSASGSYTFTAYLPTTNGYTYFSPTQASLAAGSHILNSLQFSDADGGTISIVVHPSKDSDPRGNNTDSRDLVSSYAPAYDYSYDYQYPASYQDYSYPTYAPSYTYPTQQYGYQSYDPYGSYYPQLPDESGYGYYPQYGTSDYGYMPQYAY